jgi:hypothetical protein
MEPRRRLMRRSLPALLLLLCSAFLPALSRADFDTVVDFSVTLKNLAAVAEGTERLPAGRALLLSGTVSDVSVLSKDEATFKVRIELIMGEWIGVDDVKSYACYVEFSGPEWFRIFPARAPRNAPPGVISLNARVVVVGSAIEVVTTPLGEKRVLVKGMHIRIIE